MRPEEELVQQWLDRARIDIRSAEVLSSAEPPLTENASFHCQQAVEKTLKGFLVHHGVEIEWTHEIERLINQCAELDTTFRTLHEIAKHLTVYAVRFRYPYTRPAPSVEKTHANLDVTRRVWQFVLDRLPSQVHPSG